TFANGYVFSVDWNINNILASGENTIQKFNYKIYPNPTGNNLTFSYNALSITEDYIVVITDMQGKEVYLTSFRPQDGMHNTSIDITNLSSGFYIFSIKASNYTKEFKFFKE
ncbi:MAG TPA: T9SS type A sorting domain-containing protein, partial [Saprospiraceae bacterium]|nr:T9SS type A sorting domain-containing protein [Saprospiraceae bacterium]